MSAMASAPSLGAVGFYQAPLYADEAATRRVAELQFDRRWPWRPNRYEYETRTPRARTRKDKALKVDDTVRLARDLRLPDRRAVALMNSPTADLVWCTCTIETGTDPDRQITYQLNVTQLGGIWPDHTSTSDWVELMHEMMIACRVTSGVISAWPTWNDASSDVWVREWVNPSCCGARTTRCGHTRGARSDARSCDHRDGELLPASFAAPRTAGPQRS